MIDANSCYIAREPQVGIESPAMTDAQGNVVAFDSTKVVKSM